MKSAISNAVFVVAPFLVLLLRRSTIALIAVIVLGWISPAFCAATLSGSQVTVTGECCTRGTPVTLPNTQTVPASFPTGSIVPLPGIVLLPVNIQVTATSIRIQSLGTLTFAAASFDGWVFHFTGAPTITGVSLDPSTNLPMPVVPGFKADEITVNLNPLGQSVTPSSVIVVNVTLAPSPQVLPQLAFGGGWYTARYFTNTTTAPASLMVTFTGNDGNPLTIPALGGSSVTVNLAARGTTLIEAPNVGSLVQGYVTAALPTGVSGYGVFRQSVPGVPDQEAVVPLSGNTARTSTVLFDDTKSYITGVAVVNLASVNNTITATARDNQGITLGTGTILLAPYAKTTLVMRNIPGLASIAGAVGSVDFTASIGNVAALGLRFNGTAFTSIPTSDR